MLVTNDYSVKYTRKQALDTADRSELAMVQACTSNRLNESRAFYVA